MSMYVAADDYSLSPLLSLVIAGPLDMVDMEDRVLPDTRPRGHNIAISNYQGGEKEFQTFCFAVKFAVQRSPTRNFGQRRRTYSCQPREHQDYTEYELSVESVRNNEPAKMSLEGSTSAIHLNLPPTSSSQA